MNNTIKIKVLLGSTREGRFSDKPGKWILEQLKGVHGVEAEMLDLRDYPLPFFAEALSPTVAVMKNQYPYEVSKKWTEKIGEGDAFIVVTPEYNHGYSAVLKNAFDYVQTEWNKKPIGFISYGSAGGVRAVEQLRQVVVELQMAPIRAAIHIQWAQLVEISKQAETGSTAALDSLKDPAGKMIDQLLWWANALKAAREKK